MIPKIIHYCWFGRNPLPKLALKCIESWKKYLPEYEIKEWNEDNFDINIVPYTQEAYTAKKYAFVSDYVRFWVLYKYGGIYFDTDVEVIKSMDEIIARGSFMGCERRIGIVDRLEVNPGLGLGAMPGLLLFEKILDMYSSMHFIDTTGKMNLKTVVQYTTESLIQAGLKNENEIQKCMDIYIYPQEYFCPKSFENGKIYLTKNTYTIHHFAASWLSHRQKICLILKRIMGVKNISFLQKLLKMKRVLFI